MTTPEDFYISNKRKLLKQLNKVIFRDQPQLESKYGRDTSKQIQQKILDEFTNLTTRNSLCGW